VKQHSIFLRKGCLLPDGLDLMQEKFDETWLSAGDTIASALDLRIRNAGWHFMWLVGTYSRHGFGRTAKSAISRAITLALNEVKDRFNAAELGSVRISRYPSFQIAKVTIHARQVQQQASLGLVDEMSIRQFPAQQVFQLPGASI
jgi:hypothetical protein